MSIISSAIKYLFAGKIINSCHVDYTLCGIFSSRLIHAHHGGFILRESLFSDKANGFVPKYPCTWDAGRPISLFLAEDVLTAPAGNRLTRSKIPFKVVP